MEYQTSQFDYLFLLNIPIPIALTNGEVVKLKTPSLREYYSNEDYIKIGEMFLISLLELQLNPMEFGFVAEGYLELIAGSKMLDKDNSLFKLLEEITGLEISEQGITCNGVPLREEDILEIRFAYLLSTGKMNIDGEIIGSEEHAEEDEITRKMREAEEKIQSLRGQSPEQESKISFKQILTLVMYELNKSVKDLSEMNFFGIYELYDIASRATYDKIEKIAAGNGLMSENHRYENILSK